MVGVSRCALVSPALMSRTSDNATSEARKDWRTDLRTQSSWTSWRSCRNKNEHEGAVELRDAVPKPRMDANPRRPKDFTNE